VLGLEFLIAGDIIRTVVVALVLIRTFLSLSLQLEIEGKLPWQRERPLAHQMPRPGEQCLGREEQS